MEDHAIITQTAATQQFVPQLADRLSKALANAGHLELDGNNKFHNYQYPTIAQVRGHANKALSAAGIGIIPEILQEGRNQRDTDKGKTTNVTFVKLAIHVFAPEGMFTVRWVGESEDMTDKGLAKAVSAGIKSFLLAMMLMPVGEEENDDGETDAKKAAANKRTNPAKSTKITTDRGPEWTEHPSDESVAESVQSATPPPIENGKPASLKFQAFVTWANEWVKGNGKDYAKPDGLANMYHLLGRIGKLGFASVTEQNADDIKAALESFVKGKVDTQ